MNFSLVSVLSAALLVAAGCATPSERRERTSQRAARTLDDASITANVNGLIIGDDDARFFRIDVTTRGGVVTLQGTINSRDSEARLLQKIREIEGVRSVRSMLRLDGIPS
jgi:osmotically-inducible protein OsmY